MKKITEILLSVVVFILLSAPILYVIICKPNTSFWESVASGLLSTAAALIAGIPFALWIDRVIKNKEEANSNLIKREQELELLCLIKEELSFARESLDPRIGKNNVLTLQPLKSDLWSAIISAGKLNLINNHKLLNRLTSAYYVINMVKKFEEQAYKAARSAAVTYGGGITATELLIEDARRFDTLITESIDEALNDIYSEILKNA